MQRTYGLGLVCLLILLTLAVPAGAAVATFDALSLSPNSYWNGADGTGSFISGDASFANAYNPNWGSWDGWAYSNLSDTTTRGYTNQYSAITGKDVSGSGNYSIAYDAGEWGGSSPPNITFGADTYEDYDSVISGAYFTNTVYAYYAMLEGDDFVDAFTAGDWQKLIIKGVNANGEYTGTSVDFYLADFTAADSNEWYIIDEWTWVDLTQLGTVVGLELSFEGSQPNTLPRYVAMDNLNDINPVPLPSTIWFLVSGLVVAWKTRRR